jgi:hypothetical protein
MAGGGVKLIDRLTKYPESDYGGCEGVVYDEAQVRTMAHECFELDSGVLAVDCEDGINVNFAVFAFHSGPSTRDGVAVDGAKLQVVFHGSGPSGALRELRHTHWGEGGYVFYPNAKLIAAAFAALTRWFDCDG